MGSRKSACQGRERPHTFVLPLTLVAPAPDFLRYQIRTSAGLKQVATQVQVRS
jgi:hypothetical protein